jgi:RimJ/RimL family protein N-acetyltransferase
VTTSTDLLFVDDYYVARLDREQHTRDLQLLYERCPDYLRTAFGESSRPTAAEEDFAHKGGNIFGIYSRDAELIGVLEFIRDYPKPDEWWIGLLMLDPRARGRGLGARVCRTTIDWMITEGARAVWLAVLAHNEAAHRFWTRLGFVEMERQPWVAANGHESVAILMKQGVEVSGGRGG